MAYTESTMLPLGTEAPDFTLRDVVGSEQYALHEQAKGKVAVIMFICNHCPYVLHINKALVELVHSFEGRDVVFVGISSNDVEAYPEDGPTQMYRHALEVGYNFPYLYDETQEVARAYNAACTPEFYVFDRALRLVYQGQFDDSRPRRNDLPATGKDVRAAIQSVLYGQSVSPDQRPAGGCNIKWKTTEL
jgi:peroxiredoxin